MRYRLRTLLIVLALGPPVLAQESADEAAKTNELGAYEVALNSVLETAASESVAYLAVGWRDAKTPIDPPEALLKRFADSKPPTKPASASSLSGLGKRNFSGGYRGVENPATGKPAFIYSAKIVKRHSDTRIDVAVTRFGGPLNASGYTLTLEQRMGKWIVVGMSNTWVS